MPKAVARHTSTSRRRHDMGEHIVIDRADWLGYGPAMNRFGDPGAPWTFQFSLTGEGRGGVVELKRDPAIAQAMMIIGFTSGFGSGLNMEEISLLKYIVASEVIGDRQRQILERYNAGEISKREFKRLEREARQGACWPTETFDEVKKAVVPLLELFKLRSERIVAAR